MAARANRENVITPPMLLCRYDGHCTDCPARLVQARGGEPRRNPQRVLERAGVGAALADDIEGGAVRGRREDGLQAGRHRHPLVEAEQLGRDLALVVIHHHDAVVFTLQGLQEDRVGGDRPGAADAGGSHLLHRRTDDADLLVAEQSAFAAMRSGVIRLTASRSATCEVTRKVENSLITFISPKKPECRVSAANIWCSSGYFQPPRLSAALLSGAKQMPSRPPPSARPIMCSSVSPASRPDSAETSPRLMRAGSVLPRSTRGTRSCDQSIAATVGTVCHSSSTPASLQPSSSTRASPITTTRAPLLYLPPARSLALISGPMPVMSPSISPMTGVCSVMIGGP